MRPTRLPWRQNDLRLKGEAETKAKAKAKAKANMASPNQAVGRGFIVSASPSSTQVSAMNDDVAGQMLRNARDQSKPSVSRPPESKSDFRTLWP